MHLSGVEKEDYICESSERKPVVTISYDWRHQGVEGKTCMFVAMVCFAHMLHLHNQDIPISPLVMIPSPHNALLPAPLWQRPRLPLRCRSFFLKVLIEFQADRAEGVLANNALVRKAALPREPIHLENGMPAHKLKGASPHVCCDSGPKHLHNIYIYVFKHI